MRDGLATPAKVLPVFRIKICGITNAQDAQHAARAGADAVGLNFYPASPRYIAPRTAAVIVDALPKDIVKTGVFVNATAAEICEIAAAAQLDLIQLHGDEPPELLRELSEVQKRPIMKAFRIDGGLDDVLNFLDKCSEMQCSPRLVMFDAPRAGGPQGGAYGGTGKLTNWGLRWCWRVGSRPTTSRKESELSARRPWTWPAAWKSGPAARIRPRSWPSSVPFGPRSTTYD